MRPRSPLQAQSQSLKPWTSHLSPATNTSRISCNSWTLTTSSSMASRRSWTTSFWNLSSSLISTGNRWCGTRSYSVSRRETKSSWGDNSLDKGWFKTRIIKWIALGCSMLMRHAFKISLMLCLIAWRFQMRSSSRVWCTIWGWLLTFPRFRRPVKIMKNATLRCQRDSKQFLKLRAPCVAPKWTRRNWWTSTSNCMQRLLTIWDPWKSCHSPSCNQSSTLFHKCWVISYSR